MWKKLLELVRDVFDLRRQVKGHDQRLTDLTDSVGRLSDENRSLADRVLRLELQLQHQKEQQTTERENFRLQLENLVLRLQRGLPPGEQQN
jgi:hypothetical protein